MLCNIEFQLLHIKIQRSHAGSWRSWFCTRFWWYVEVRVYQDLLFREIGHQHVSRVITSGQRWTGDLEVSLSHFVRHVLHMPDLHLPLVIADDVFSYHRRAAHRFNRRRPPDDHVHRVKYCHPIRVHRPRKRTEQDSDIIVSVRLVGYDRGSLREIRAETTSISHVVICIDHVPNHFTRNEFMNFLHDRQRPRLVLRRFDDRNKVLELDEHAVHGPSAQEPDMVRKLLRVHLYGIEFCRPRHFRNRNLVHNHIGLNILYVDLKIIFRSVDPGIALMYMDQPGKHHAVVILVLCVAHFIGHIAIDRVSNPRASEFDEILIVDRAVDSVLSIAEGDDRHPLAKRREAEVRGTHDGLRDRGRVGGGQRRLYKSVWSEHHLELPQFTVGHAIEIQARERHGRITLHVPSEIAAQDVCDVNLRHRRLAVRRVAALLLVIVQAHIFGVEVDRARVVGNLKMRQSVVSSYCSPTLDKKPSE